MIPYEENILHILKKSKVTFMSEISDWNPDGITEEEAKVIAQRHSLTLEILESSFLPTLRVFRFEINPNLDDSVKRNDQEGKG